MVKLGVPRPFLKWAGGKTQLVHELYKRRPPSFQTYHEPFLGSGAFFFFLYRNRVISRACLSDINPELIDTFIAIRDHVAEVIAILSDFPYSREFYYELRAKDPWKLSLPERAARMIYLNKTGYNGLYRLNREGKFNVPFGRYKSPKFLDKENLLAVSRALWDVEICCDSFEKVLNRVQSGDWVYFDPPYIPLSHTANFTTYYRDGFDLEDQKRLGDVCVALTKRGVFVTLSNSDTPYTRAIFNREGFNVYEVQANRAINSNGSRRGKITELIITNYSALIPQIPLH